MYGFRLKTPMLDVTELLPSHGGFVASLVEMEASVKQIQWTVLEVLRAKRIIFPGNRERLWRLACEYVSRSFARGRGNALTRH